MVRAQSSDTVVTDKEVVKATLDQSGDVAEVEVNGFLRAEGTGKVGILDPAVLSGVVGDPSPEVDGTNLAYDLDVPDSRNPVSVYYRGDANVLSGVGLVQTPSGPKQIPVRVTTQYTFEGAEVDDLSKIAGLGGQFEMEVTIENVTGRAEEVTYKDSTSGKDVTDVGFTFIPLTIQAGPWNFDDASWKDIEVENAQISRNGDSTQVSAANVLFPPTTEASHTIKVTALTNGFSLDSGRIAVTPGVGTSQPASVQDAQEKGGGATTQLYGALQSFFDGFLALTDPEEGLPFAANAVDQIINEGVLLLKDTLLETAQALEDEAKPSIEELGAGLVSLRDAVSDELGPGVAGIRDFIGTGRYFEPTCRDLPINYEANHCRFGLDRFYGGDTPLQVANRDTFVIGSNADTRGQVVDDSDVLGSSTYNIEKIQRTKKGSVARDIVGGAVDDDGAQLGSLYNWVQLLKDSTQPPADIDKDDNPDFGPFVWPNPDQFPEVYTAAAMDGVTSRQGELFPGHTDIGGWAPNGFVVDFCTTVAGANEAPGLGEDANGNGIDDGAEHTCKQIPREDVTVKDVLTDVAWKKIDPIVIAIPIGDLTGGSAALTDLSAQLAPGAAIARDKALTFEQQATKGGPLAGFQQAIAEGLNKGADALENEAEVLENPVTAAAGETMLRIPLPLGRILVGGSDRGINNALANPKIEHLEGFIDWADGRVQQVLNLPVVESTCLVIGDPGSPTLTLGLGELLGIDCSFALTGALGTNEIALTVLSNFLSSTGWNFDNWRRGDPGYTVDDLGILGTGPKLYEILNLIAFSIDRASALCPSEVVTDPDGGGTPRIIPPELTTPCDEVLPVTDAANTDDTTLVAALSDLIIPGVGDPDVPDSDQDFDDEGNPNNLLTLMTALIDGLGKDAPEALGDNDPSQAGVTLAGSLAAVRDGLFSAADQLAPAVTGTPLLIGAVGGAQIEGDLNTALSKRGLERAEEYNSFMGLASFEGGAAVGQLMFVLETVGVKE